MIIERTKKLNIDEQEFNNPISQILTGNMIMGGIEALKLRKMSSHSDIENLTKNLIK